MLPIVGGVDRIFDALGDPTRVAIVLSLTERDRQTLFELCTRLLDAGHAMSRQAVARHVAVLTAAGLVSVTTVGRTSVHRLERGALVAAQEWLSTLSTTDREERS